MHHPAAPQDLKRELDRCVKCGMCLPECPTYRLQGDENESPRGRLALIEGLVDGRLRGDDALARHLDSCLICRRCERLCPSQVRYGYLIDHGRALLPRRRGRWLGRWIENPRLFQAGTRMARAVPTFLSWALGGRLRRLHEVARALPRSAAGPRPGDYPAIGGPAKGRVGLFTGCTGQALQGGALDAALTLIRHAGYTVTVPPASCCGALSQHAGDQARAEGLADHNRALFADGIDALVSIASGCGIHLDAYRPPLPVRHLDIGRFLLEEGGFSSADFMPLPGRVALHTPCSMENVYRGGEWARALLALIPRLEVVAVGETGQCCGAAGDHMLREPDRAARLRRPLVEQLAGGGFTQLATGNVGCAIHLAAGLENDARRLEILHPVEILARQLRT